MAKSNKESDLGAILLVVGIGALLVVAPALAVYDVVAHNRRVTGVASDLSDSSIIYILAHTAYISCAVVAIFLLVSSATKIFMPEDSSPRGGTARYRWVGDGVVTLLCAVYAAPFLWLLFYVPGYWRVLFDMVWDAIF